MSDLRPWPDLNALVAKAIEGGATVPEGVELTWAWKSVRPDLRSHGGYRWPWPGSWASCPDDGRSLEATGHPCPSSPDPHGRTAVDRQGRGGLNLAKTVRGAASGGIPLGTALLCGYVATDVLGQDSDKIRVRRAWVLDVFDAVANLRGADLRYADLRYADLRYADLRDADLWGADLRGAFYNPQTIWPGRYDPKATQAVAVA